MHLVHILMDGVQMGESPFRVRVGGAGEEVDPAAVQASGAGLRSGLVGQKADFVIDTCNAGAGTLQCTMDGPSKVSLDAYEVDVGYKVRYTPLAAGTYFAAVKYNGIHVPGSPFKITVTGSALLPSSKRAGSTRRWVQAAPRGATP